MNFKLSTKRISDYFENETRRLFQLSMGFFIISFILEIFVNSGKYEYSPLSLNLIFLAILIALFYIGQKRILSIQVAYAVTVYLFIAMVIFSYVYSFNSLTDNFFVVFQDIMYVHLIIISAGIIVSKRHVLIISTILTFFYPIIMWISGIPHLRSAIPFVILFIIGPGIVLFYILNSFERSLEHREKLKLETEKQRNELKRLNEEKDKLFSLIAHDLRGPIGNVKNMINFTFDSFLSETEKEEILHSAVISLDKTFALLTSLLDWSTNQLGVFKYSPRNIDLHLLVQDTIDFLSTISSDKEIKIINSVTPNLMTFSDKTLLASILRNLLSNAIKFSERSGTIKIESDYYGGNILVKIRDFGRGIPEEKLGTLFNDNLGKTSLGTENEEGYGFGLSLVKEFVEKNGGQIWVKSKPSKGTTFYFTIPLSDI